LTVTAFLVAAACGDPLGGPGIWVSNDSSSTYFVRVKSDTNVWRTGTYEIAPNAAVILVDVVSSPIELDVLDPIDCHVVASVDPKRTARFDQFVRVIIDGSHEVAFATATAPPHPVTSIEEGSNCRPS
jgi:hypothetical protein